MPKKTEDKKAKTMEEMLSELEELSEQLEDDTLPLEEAFLKYQEGMQLLKQCNDAVEKVEKNLQILEENAGEPVAESED